MLSCHLSQSGCTGSNVTDSELKENCPGQLATNDITTRTVQLSVIARFSIHMDTPGKQGTTDVRSPGDTVKYIVFIA